MYAHGLQACHYQTASRNQTQSVSKMNIKDKYIKQLLKGTGKQQWQTSTSRL